MGPIGSLGDPSAVGGRDPRQSLPAGTAAAQAGHLPPQGVGAGGGGEVLLQRRGSSATSQMHPKCSQNPRLVQVTIEKILKTPNEFRVALFSI